MIATVPNDYLPYRERPLALAKSVATAACRRWNPWLRGREDEAYSEALVAVARTLAHPRFQGAGADMNNLVWVICYRRLVDGLKQQNYLPKNSVCAGGVKGFGLLEADTGCPLAATVAVEDQALATADARDLVGSCLDARQADMVWRRYVGGERLRDLGERWGVSQQWATMLVRSGLAKLRRAIRRGER